MVGWPQALPHRCQHVVAAQGACRGGGMAAARDALLHDVTDARILTLRRQRPRQVASAEQQRDDSKYRLVLRYVRVHICAY